MSKQYNFNHSDFKKYINRGYYLLRNANLSPKEKFMIRDDINFLSNFLNENGISYEPLAVKSNCIRTFQSLKTEYINFLKVLYRELGERLINFIIDLESENILCADYNYIDSGFIIPLEYQEELTLRNYEKNSKILYSYAQEMFSKKPTSKIQEMNICDGSSYCHYSSILNLPFLVINPSEAPYVLNHEVEHGVECLLNLDINDEYKELGPIYFELLFNDMLYDSNRTITPSSYVSRLVDAEDILYELTKTFNVIKELVKYNFMVSDAKFKSILIDILKLHDNNVYSYLINDDLLINIKTQIRYLLSYLKAIELRKITDRRNDSFYILREYLNQRNFSFKPDEKSYDVYKEFVNEMKSKSKHFD